MTHARIAALASLCCALTAPALAAPTPEADIVGEIISATGGQFAAVTITHRGRLITARYCEPVYPGDTVKVVKPGVSVILEFRGGRSLPLDIKYGPFLVPEMNRRPWSTSEIRRVLRLLPSIFGPPDNVDVVDTIAASFHGVSPHARKVLPAVEQTLRARDEPFVLPVVWQGARFPVRLIDEDGSVVTEEPAAAPGWVLLHVAALPAGRYTIEIGQRSTTLVMPLKVVGAPAPAGSGVDATLAAVGALLGPAGGRLQALVDLYDLSDDNYVAYAALRHSIGFEAAAHTVKP